MKRILLCLLLAFTIFFFNCNRADRGTPRILVFTKTTGYRHSSIAKGIAAMQRLGRENAFDVDTTENAKFFNEDSLKKYSCVVFLNTTGNVLDHVQEIAFERYIQSGGGFVGIHSATDTEYDWGWYGQLVGGYFNGHPENQEANLNVVDPSHASTKHLQSTWRRLDEWYNFKKLDSSLHVLLTIDENSYNGGTNGAHHPISWYHEYDGGRAFYTAMGHTEESYSDSLYLKHVVEGIKYSIGDNRKLNYSRAHSEYPPDEKNFTKTILTKGEFFEPTEFTILPNYDILIVQRRGEIMLYKNETKKVSQAGLLDVYWKTKTDGANAEEGLLGIAKDPAFEKNNYVYIFYSPSDTSVNRLSRFEFRNDKIVTSSEKTILQFYSQREICCHTGGSIAFGPDGLLYVSTGDNSTPFAEPDERYLNMGFAPIDDRPGHEQYDAARSASNSNDLRGKIIRIKENPDGSYTIPPGNLFPSGMEKTRPEIYVMGTRNAYRISVDQKNSFLYWGDVGPDSPVDSFQTRGPRGYDEVNQARKSGYFGWPFFVGNNFAYREYNSATGKTGEFFDPLKPLNKSRNNTGLTELPAVSPAFIWYPYDVSGDFPQMGSGGRTAMAGPVYYSDLYDSDSRLPGYYNGKLFFYEFMRGWVKVATLKPNGDLWKIEPFMGSTKFAAPMDMELGPDGRLYILEYGTGWFNKNPDAGLSRIDYAR